MRIRGQITAVTWSRYDDCELINGVKTSVSKQDKKSGKSRWKRMLPMAEFEEFERPNGQCPPETKETR